jgi:glycosyltransferase involved in cell wall biosynthesis
MITFSVIIPCHNAEKFIEQCLNSVFNQTYSPYEIIVIDDGSTDGSRLLLTSYGERINLISQENLGAGAARNAGMRISTGSYLAFLDADDIWLPNTLKHYATVIEATHAYFISGYAFQFSGDKPDDPKTLHDKLSYGYFNTPMHAVNKTGFWLFLPGALAVKRDIALCSGGYAEGLINSEDAAFVFKLGEATGCCLIHTPPLVLYRKHPVAATLSFERSYRGLLHLLNGYRKKDYPTSKIARKGQAYIIGTYSRSLCIGALRTQRYREGFSIYLKTFTINLSAIRLKYLIGAPAIGVMAWVKSFIW